MAEKAIVEGEEVEAYPEEEQGIEPEETSEEEKLDMDTGEKDEDVYSEEGREKLEEDDELEPWEEGYMEGAEHKGEQGMCAHCRKVLDQEKDQIVEKEVKGRVLWFCSEECASKGPRFKVEG
jgi:hypothetical protein